jgi:hypothetical protein
MKGSASRAFGATLRRRASACPGAAMMPSGFAANGSARASSSRGGHHREIDLVVAQLPHEALPVVADG